MAKHESSICMGCGQLKECYTYDYGKAEGSTSVVRITDMNRNLIWNNKLTCSMCDECIGQTGPRVYNWVWWVLGIAFVLVAFSIYNFITEVSSPDMPAGVPLILLAWILSIIGVTSGFSKLWGHKTGKYAGALIFGLFFGLTQIPTIILLIAYKRVKRIAWVEKRMKETANQIYNDKEKASNQKFAEIAKKDLSSLTDQEKKMLADKKYNDIRVQAEKLGQQQKVSKGNYTRAIIGIVITCIIAIVGLSTYDSGGYMQWFGIELSSGAFIALIAAFIVYDIFAIVSARRKVAEINASQSEPVNPNFSVPKQVEINQGVSAPLTATATYNTNNISISSNEVKFPVCSMVQPSDRNFCINCGTRLAE